MRNRCLEVFLAEKGDEIVGSVKSYGDPLFVLECLTVIIGEIARKSGVPVLEVAADLHGLIAQKQRNEGGNE